MSATNRSDKPRNERDFYATPEMAFKNLLPHLPKDRHYWEPAAGDGRLIEWMRQYGLNADGADLEPQAEGLLKANYLEDNTDKDIVVTNPPFSLAFEFCKHAVAHANDVFFLLRLNFLASSKRRDWFVNNEPAALYILSKRPSFTSDGKTDATDYAWFHWSRGSQKTGIFHL